MNASNYWIETPNITENHKWQIVDYLIKTLLDNCNWTQTPDNGLSIAERTAWDVYREQVRDSRFMVSLPDDVIFPEPPAIVSAPHTAAQLAARARRKAAITNAKTVAELKGVTQDQAAAYVEQQITNGVTQAQALTAFDNAATFAAAKPILRSMLLGMYATVSILKLMARILIAMRDQLWPDLPDINSFKG